MKNLSFLLAAVFDMVSVHGLRIDSIARPHNLNRRSWMQIFTAGGFSWSSFNSIALANERSDEYSLLIDEGPIGIELADISRYVNELRVYVKSVTPGSRAEGVVSEGDILVSLNGRTLETMSAKRVRDNIANEPRPLRLVFRDPSKFNSLLQPAGVGGDLEDQKKITSQIAPKAVSRDAAIIGVERVKVPEICKVGVRKGDLLEISYSGKLADGFVFDGSAQTIGRGGDPSIFFVLGDQPTGQFPPGWDLGLVGMCVGEVRTITVPPVLGYGSKVFS
jgi:FK506-binding protein 2